MEDDLGWLQHLGDDPCLNIKPQYNFWAFISFSLQPSLPQATLQAQESPYWLLNDCNGFYKD